MQVTQHKRVGTGATLDVVAVVLRGTEVVLAVRDRSNRGRPVEVTANDVVFCNTVTCAKDDKRLTSLLGSLHTWGTNRRSHRDRKPVERFSERNQTSIGEVRPDHAIV